MQKLHDNKFCDIMTLSFYGINTKALNEFHHDPFVCSSHNPRIFLWDNLFIRFYFVFSALYVACLNW
jgi:hypothetical protein